MNTILAIGDREQCEEIITSATGNGWRVLHTTQLEDIPCVLEQTHLDLIALIGSVSPQGWERVTQLLCRLDQKIPILTCSPDAPQTVLFRALIVSGVLLPDRTLHEPSRATALSTARKPPLRQSSLSQTLTLLEQPDTGILSGIQIALDYIAACYTDSITLDDVAQAACYSRCHFCKVFKEQIGMSFVAYLSEFRIQRAVELLLHSQRAITDIAFEVGFNDLSHFERVFRSRRKQTASQFRQQAKHSMQSGQFLRGKNALSALS